MSAFIEKVMNSGLCNRSLGEDRIDYKNRIVRLIKLINPDLNEAEIIDLSICTYNDGLFQVMIKDDKGNDVTLEGTQKLSDIDFDFINEVAPACVYTKYKRI